MIEDRELNIDDYLAIARRRLWLVLVPLLLASAAGFLISFAFAPRYTSQSLILVQGQQVPEGYVKDMITGDVGQRVINMEQQILSRNQLQPLIERYGLLQGAGGQGALNQALNDVRQGVSVDPVDDNTLTLLSKKKPGSDLSGFTIKYTASNPRLAQQICGELTSMLLQEDLRERQQQVQGTTDFLSHQVEEAKRNLDEQDAKLAAFKRRYVGEEPGEAENNLKILMTLNSQLEALTQTVNRAQQDKTYEESVLEQQLAALKASQISTPQAVQQQLAALQNQLVALSTRYTNDHPDVIKLKGEIAELKAELNSMASAKTIPDEKIQKTGLVAEPPEIRQLRAQIHQNDQIISQATSQQVKLQQQINLYQGRVEKSPAVEEQYKALTRDYDTANKFYSALLDRKSESEMARDMELHQQGEQFRVLEPAGLPLNPSFPNPLLFAGGGLGAGLGLGVCLAFWFEMRDKAIRTEQDVEAALQLAPLVSLPWIDDREQDRNGSKMPNGKEEAGDSINRVVAV